MSKKKLFIVSWYGIKDAGGVERVTQYLVQAWSDMFDVSIIDFETIEKKCPVCSKLLHKHISLDGVIVSLFTRRLMKKNPEAKIVTQGFNCPFVKADLFIAHGTSRGYRCAVSKSKRWHFNQVYEKIGMMNAAKVMAVSKHTKEEVKILYKINEEKIIVLENCVDTDVFYPIHKQKRNSECRIIFVGRLEYGKGLDVLLKFAKIIEERENFRLLIATNDSNNIEKFSNLKKTEIKVGLNGQQMNDFYNEGDILFFPSLYEGFEMVTTECLSAGIPVVGNQVGAVGDLYDCGQCGVDIIVKDYNQLLDKIKSLSEAFYDFEKRQGLHNDMKEKFGLEVYMNKLRTVLE